MFTIKIITKFNNGTVLSRNYSCQEYEKYEYSDRFQFFFSCVGNKGITISKNKSSDMAEAINIYVENIEGKTIDSAHGYGDTDVK